MDNSGSSQVLPTRSGRPKILFENGTARLDLAPPKRHRSTQIEEASSAEPSIPHGLSDPDLFSLISCNHRESYKE